MSTTKKVTLTGLLLNSPSFPSLPFPLLSPRRTFPHPFRTLDRPFRIPPRAHRSDSGRRETRLPAALPPWSCPCRPPLWLPRIPADVMLESVRGLPSARAGAHRSTAPRFPAVGGPHRAVSAAFSRGAVRGKLGCLVRRTLIRRVDG